MPEAASSAGSTSFDVLVIGGGPGGYVAAIRAAQLGFKVGCVEKRKALGGTCLNVGCIPSKALLDSSEHYAHTKHGLERHGILVKGVELNLSAMMARKDQVVTQLTGGIAGLFKKNKIEHLLGHGKLLSATEVEITTPEGTKKKISAKKIILATGSEVGSLPGIALDGKRIVSSTEALMFPEVPKHLIVIGAGAIGLEMGSVWSRLGSKVTVVEFQDRIAAASDKDASAELLKVLKKQGMEFKLSHKVLQAKNDGKSAWVEIEDLANKKTERIEGDYVLMSVGRKPNSEGLGLKELGVTQDKQGRVEVNSHYETNIKGVYAIGDLIKGPMLAHKAEDEGVAVAELLAGKPGHVNYEAIPSVIYTWPELASVGATEDDLKAKSVQYKTGKFPFLANGRAKAMAETDGFVKILADAKTDRILGVHIVGPRASDMIAELVIAMEFSASSEDIARSTHAHPTLAEIIKEAALAVDKRQIHL